MSNNDLMSPDPNASRAPRKRKGLLWLRIFLLTWVAFILAFILNMCDQGDKHPTPQPDVDWGNAAPTGYRGSARDTRALSPEWASGIAVAWTQPFDAAAAAVPPRLFAEGSTLYVVSYGPNSNAVTTITAYDVSGAEPSALWTTTGPRPSRLRTYAYPEFLSTDTHLVIGPLLVDKATGEQTLAPWGNELPMGVAQGVLVTCDTVATCSGWTDEEGAWAQQWSTTTSPQSHNGLTFLSPITHPTDALTGSGENTSVLVPVDVSHAAPQLIDPRTGELRTLGTPPSKDEEIKPQVTLASDGVAVLRDGNTVTAYDPSGTVVDTYKITIQWVRPTSDSSLPTLEQLRSFYTKETTPWTTSFVSAEGATDHSPPSLEVSTSTGESLSMQPDGAFLKESSQPNFFSSVAMRSSADGSVLYLRGAGPAGTPAFVFAMADNVTNRSEQLDEATNLTWVFDDLLVGVTKNGLVAFTPDRD
mgnify:CR=1 FL=1